MNSKTKMPRLSIAMALLSAIAAGAFAHPDHAPNNAVELSNAPATVTPSSTLSSAFEQSQLAIKGGISKPLDAAVIDSLKREGLELDRLSQKQKSSALEMPIENSKMPPSHYIDALQDAIIDLQDHSLVAKQFASPANNNALSPNSRAQLTELLNLLENTATGRAPLPEAALCLGDRGLPKLLNALSPNLQVHNTRTALSKVCEHVGEYAKAELTEVSDPFASTDSNLTIVDTKAVQAKNENCARVGIRTPDMPGVNPFFELDGYALNVASDAAYLEEGQRFAVKTSCATPLGKSYGTRLSLTYKINGLGPDVKLLISGFIGNGQSVAMPSTLFPASFFTQVNPAPISAILHTQTVSRNCILGTACTDTLLGTESSRQVLVHALGSMCSANLAYKKFAINDRLSTASQFMSNVVSSITVDGIFGQFNNAEFAAYAPTINIDTSIFPIGVTSSFPTFNPIKQEDLFAVHSVDTLSLFDPTISRATYISTSGTLAQSGLRFPRIVGNNFSNGEGYSFSCKLPRIVRDYVAFCTAVGKPTDSLYLLPYRGKTLTTQGNNGAISHNNAANKFAWDFETVLATSKGIYAARAGRVVEVIDTFSGNCSGCPNNIIRLAHQDGTETRYLHGATGGAEVAVGDIVARGQLLGESGNVGNSTAQHIHFTAATSNGTSIPASFDDQDEPCVIPVGPFDTKESTLTPGQDRVYKYRSSNLNFPGKQ